MTYPDQPGAPVPPAVPGKGLAIAGLILAILLPLIGLIISIIATVKLKKAGAPAGIGIAGIIIGAILTVLGIIVFFVTIASVGAVFGGLMEVCNELGPGVWELNGVTYTCG